jgi:hypothetical protein
MASITSNPLSELAFGPAVFSPMKNGVSSRSTEPSQPWQNKTGSNKLTVKGCVVRVEIFFLMIAYVNEAVVEVEAEEGGGHAGVGGNGVLDS